MERLLQPWRSPRAATAVYVLWAAITGVAVVQGLIPESAGGSEVPWSMFSTQGPVWSRVVAEVEVDGAWQPLPLEDWFRYHRGMTEFGIPDESPALMGAKRAPRARAAFAAWLVVQAEREGRAVERVRLRRRITHFETGRVRWVELGTFEAHP